MARAYSNDLRRKFFQAARERLVALVELVRHLAGRLRDGGEHLVVEDHFRARDFLPRLAQAHRLRLSVGWLWVVVVQQLGLPLKKSHSTRRNKIARKRSGADKRGGKKSGP